MEHRFTPEFFYGSAVAALFGLLFGLLLHAAWEKRPGGPQILFSSAAAAEAAAPATEPADPPEPVDVAAEDTSYVPPDPLPVVRLHPEMFDVQPAAADDAQRQDVDDAADAAAPEAPPHDID